MLRLGSNGQPANPVYPHIVTRASLLLLLVAAATAQAQPHRFDRTSISYTSPKVSIRTERLTALQMGWRKCDPGGRAFTTRAPAMTWDVAERMELRIRLLDDAGRPTQVGGVIVVPDGSYVCANDRR